MELPAEIWEKIWDHVYLALGPATFRYIVVSPIWREHILGTLQKYPLEVSDLRALPYIGHFPKLTLCRPILGVVREQPPVPALHLFCGGRTLNWESLYVPPHLILDGAKVFSIPTGLERLKMRGGKIGSEVALQQILDVPYVTLQKVKFTNKRGTIDLRAGPHNHYLDFSASPVPGQLRINFAGFNYLSLQYWGEGNDIRVRNCRFLELRAFDVSYEGIRNLSIFPRDVVTSMWYRGSEHSGRIPFEEITITNGCAEFDPGVTCQKLILRDSKFRQKDIEFVELDLDLKALHKRQKALRGVKKVTCLGGDPEKIREIFPEAEVVITKK